MFSWSTTIMYLIYMPSKFEERTPDRATDILDNVQLTVNFIRKIIIPQTSPLWAQMGLFRASARECHMYLLYSVPNWSISIFTESYRTPWRNCVTTQVAEISYPTGCSWTSLLLSSTIVTILPPRGEWFAPTYILAVELIVVFVSRMTCVSPQEASMEELAELIPIKAGMVAWKDLCMVMQKLNFITPY